MSPENLENTSNFEGWDLVLVAPTKPFDTLINIYIFSNFINTSALSYKPLGLSCKRFTGKD